MNLLRLKDLGSVRALCRELVDDLRQGCSFVWLLPSEELLDQLLSIVIEECEWWRLGTREVDLPALPGRVVGRELAELLDLDLNYVRGDWGPNHIMETGDCPDVIVLRNLTALAPDQQNRWSQFAVHWSRAAHATSSSKALLIPAASALEAKVVKDVRLRVQRVWRYISQLEMQMLARGQTGQSPAEIVWNEAVYASIAAGDPMLLEWLLDEPDLDLPELKQQLAAYGERSGWTVRTLKELRADRLCELSLAARTRPLADIPQEFEGLWQIGAVTATGEYGLELHSAAAAMISRDDHIEHRVWRGQVQVLLPVLDSLRQAISHYLTRHYGPSWIDLATPQYQFEVHGTPEKPMSEFNHLYNVVKSPRLRLPHHGELHEKIRMLRDWRNSLAHYVPIRRADVDRLFDVVGHLESLR